jgi:hypothetical protein
MTVEARYRILGIPIISRELFPQDGEMYAKLDRDATKGEHKPLISVTTLRVLSEDEIAIWQYKPSSGNPDILERGKPTVLIKDQINSAHLRTSTSIITGEVRWRQRI